MESLGLIGKFHSNLPVMREWIENILAENINYAVYVIDLGFPRLDSVFPLDLLKRAKSVLFNGKLPFPPLSRMYNIFLKALLNRKREHIPRCLRRRSSIYTTVNRCNIIRCGAVVF